MSLVRLVSGIGEVLHRGSVGQELRLAQLTSCAGHAEVVEGLGQGP
ncbi:hypothetical protein [Streptomyces sp. TE5632]